KNKKSRKHHNLHTINEIVTIGPLPPSLQGDISSPSTLVLCNFPHLLLKNLATNEMRAEPW
ncbi:MAG: hypothetical protein V3V81_06220, partial [Candidatus Bathyarchaeia archaeon]